jgi:hypothetical protein
MISPTFLIITLQKAISMYKKMFFLCLIPLFTQATEVTAAHLVCSDGQVNFENLVFYEPTISKKTCFFTALTTTGVALLSGYGVSALFKDSNITTPLLIGSFLGTLAGWGTYIYQPESKFQHARNKLFEAVKDRHLNKLIANQQDLLKNIDHIYLRFSLPLVNANKKILAHFDNLAEAFQSLENVIEQSENQDLAKYAKSYLPVINEYLNHIANCIEIIKTDSRWLPENNCYQQAFTNNLLLLLTVFVSLNYYSRINSNNSVNYLLLR